MKQYHNEKAVISLTSWKGRINQVGKVIYSIFKHCPDFHIVLVLSNAEFPLKEKELPQDLLVLLNHNLFELLWVKENYKSLKKVLYTMDKYRDLPVISADDDCLYTCNYAKILYDAWLSDKRAVITTKPSTRFRRTCTQYGECTLHPPYLYGPLGILALNLCANDFLSVSGNDDHFMSSLREVLNLNRYRILNIKNTDLHVWYNSASTILQVKNDKMAYEFCTKLIRDKLLKYFKSAA